MPNPVSQYRFGPFEFCLKTRKLTREGLKLKVRPQPLHVLQVLLESGGEVVTRQELQARLWPSETFVDFEHGLNTAVKELRSVLNDSASNPEYIETLPKFGYRFLAQVDSIANHAPEQAATGTLGVAPPPHRGEGLTAKPAARTLSLRIASIAAAVIVIAAIAGTVVLSRPHASPRLIRFVGAVVSERADPWQRLLTDGQNVYFMENVAEKWIQAAAPIEGGQIAYLATPFEHTRIFDISKDHSEFLIGDFNSRQVLPAPLWTWPVLGGAPVRVGGVLAHEAAWYPNGGEILYMRGSEIHRVHRDGSQDRLLIKVQGSAHCPRVSPDGSRFSYSVGDLQTTARALWEANADGSDPHLRFAAADDTRGEWCGEWTADGKYFFYTAIRQDVESFHAIRETRSAWNILPESAVEVAIADGPVYGAAPVGNGARTFVFSGIGEFQSMRYDVQTHEFSSFLTGTNTLGMSFSADGKWVAYQRMPDWTIWRSKLDGSQRIQLVRSPAKAGQPRWSPDGSQIAFEARYPGKPLRAYLVGSQGGAVKEILPQIEGAQSLPSWCSSDESVVLAANPRDDSAPATRRGIFRVNLATQQAEKLPGSEGLTHPSCSPDGKYLVAKNTDDTAILIYDSSSRKWSQIVRDSQIGGIHWSTDSKYLFAQNSDEDGQPIFRYRAGSFKREPFLLLNSLLKEGVVSATLQDFAADGSPMFALKRKGVGIYALDLDLP